ncbi:MAG: alpha-ribazole phosphatase family protein [Bacteroides sp.]|nr:alpha-ribazole phosphatase family protein [Roseburia sp.]MCM1346849.1 alpha-ribazole phosphatase family protein [Bacteroides sp.]MCM1419935.1 alpha-ribazole phosphatase family protein [Bacteroides sp.]
MEIYFIRHTSVAVPKGICYGNTDVSLNPTFESEASDVKRKLSGIVFDKVYTSPLTRAKLLASYCGYSDARQDNRLLEFNFGEWEMQSYDKLYAEDEWFKQWCEDYVNLHTPGGECLLDLQARVNSFIDEMVASGCQRIAAFCHGGIIAAAMLRKGMTTYQNAFSDVPSYGSVVSFTF